MSAAVRCAGAALGAALAVVTPCLAGPHPQAASDQLAHDIFRQLIEIDTSDASGNVTTAAQALAQRFRAAGFAAADVMVLGPNERKKNLVVRLRGSGAHRPVLLIGHLDVVNARREDWSTDPFKLIEKDGYFYGRGTLDMKSGDAIMAASLLRMKQEGVHPGRDIILALTADEEGGCCNGVDWLLQHQRGLLDAEFVINHDGRVGYSVVDEHGVPREFDLSATEKHYADYQLSITNRGGHSSIPRADNAIYQLAAALLRIAQHPFPVELNDITRSYFGRTAAVSSGPTARDLRAVLANPPDAAAAERLSRDPEYNSLLRTTCVATRLAGGHANNALPQLAQAVVNCRILPGHSKEEVRQELMRVSADPQLTVRFIADNGAVSERAPQARGQPPSPLLPEVMRPLESAVAATWPHLPVLPFMNAGATDGIYTRAAGMPTYGVAGIAIDRDDVRAHGRDERVAVGSFYTGNAFFWRFLTLLTAP